jgi:hypothetical protein
VVRSSALLREAGAGAVYGFFGRGGGGQRREPFDDDAPAARPAALRRGSRVRHPTLGEGMVLEVEGDLDEGKLTIYFDRAGKRKLLARYANLEPL